MTKFLVALVLAASTDWGPDIPYGGRPYREWELPDPVPVVTTEPPSKKPPPPPPPDPERRWDVQEI